MPKISVVTATFNAEKFLPSLIQSLRDQTFKDFEWIVADGNSTDDTLKLLAEVNGINLIVSSMPDFGIFDGLNRAIKLTSADCYVAIGADDVFLPDALENFLAVINQGFVIAASPILINNKPNKLSKLPISIIGFKSKIYGYSGTAFKKSLHHKYGYYTKKFPLAADYEFMLKLILGKEKIGYIEKPTASFGLSGASSNDLLGCFTEVMRVNISLGFNALAQLSYFNLRTLKYLITNTIVYSIEKLKSKK